MIKIFISNQFSTIYYNFNDRWYGYNKYGFLDSGLDDLNKGTIEFKKQFKEILEFEE